MSQPAHDKIRLLALSPYSHQDYYYDPLRRPPFELIISDQWEPAAIHQHSPDVLITLTCHAYQLIACIEEARKLRIPSLLMMDGILEWRHTWENPSFGAGGWIPFDQPIANDKIACFGWQNARTLEGWGNVGKCEIVGASRFDHYLENPVKHTSHQGRRLLIMTANNPGFSEAQRQQVRQSLVDVRDYLQNQTDWEPIWRVRRGLDEELGLTDHYPELREKPLREVMEMADAVLTNPSTVLVEGWLAGLPSAILDYTNSPTYVQAAWMVTAREQLAPVLSDLLAPPATRMVFQDEVLHNTLECHTPATPRLVKLLEDMARLGREARAGDTPLVLPPRLIPLELGGHAVPSAHFDFAALYPQHPIYTNRDLNAVQRELTLAHRELRDLRQEVKRRGMGFWVQVVVQRVQRFLKRR